jgi:C4-type Zn-finger protein
MPTYQEIANSTEGQCPKCGGTDFDWGGYEIDGGVMTQQVTCDDCCWTGWEVNSIVFSHFAEYVE